VYTGLDIGTGKVTEEEKEEVQHYMLDVAPPERVYTAHDYVRDTSYALEEIQKNGKLPIIAGGTGFYIDALCGRTILGAAGVNATLRAELATKDTETLIQLLTEQDPQRAADIIRKKETNNRVRLIRAIEIAQSPKAANSEPHTPLITDALWIGVTHPPEVLRARILTRLTDRIRAGMFDEMRHLHAQGLSYERMDTLGLEYRYGARYLQGQLSAEMCEKELGFKIWQYSKRQMTYWRRNKDIHWFAPSAWEDIQRLIAAYLAS
jgi:tRNA dimethylallyltransferase